MIIEINKIKIENQEKLSQELSKYSSGDQIIIKTKYNNTINSYEIKLAESPLQENKAFLGISSFNSNNQGFKGLLYKFFTFFEDPSTAVKPKFNRNSVIFIRDLLWWIIIINILVALFNMLPIGILDGGRFFFLTILSIVKNEKIAKKVSKLAAYLVLLIFILIMASWFIALI